MKQFLMGTIATGSGLRESKYTKGIVRCEMVDSHSDNNPTKKTEKLGKETEKEEEEEEEQQQQQRQQRRRQRWVWRRDEDVEKEE